MKQHIAALTLASIASISHADVISQVVSFDAGFDGTFVNFEQFDTMGGTRELTGLSLSYDQTMSLDMTFQSNGYTALSDGDWTMGTGVPFYPSVRSCR